MATRSRIGYINKDGKIVSAYCHFDGYPHHNGKLLLENYTNLEKVQTLVDGGDMSYLAKNCGKPEGHSFEHPVKDHVVYYGRDRGELNVKTIVLDNISQLFEVANNSWVEFIYLFDNGDWKYSDMSNMEFKNLTKEICK
mgnify:CR=1 FL=1